ncbi:hypothetical protein HCJ46_16260 [Listeria booriae]|uniref:pLS20_p028 family conjugation system transmembrane protein n=1 Tax=Listeria booriae TaxID=1552123 RepID=UPI001624F300|nr:hypothetical protein [Listeria booriae]MBC1920313.1 hypothetical protein [Listeria booriae]
MRSPLTDEQIIDLLLRFSDVLRLTNWWSAIFREFMWAVNKGLATVIEALNTGLDQVFKLFRFFESTGVENFLTMYMPVFFALAGAAIVYMGFQIMRNKGEPSKMVSALLIGITLFVVLPWGMTQMKELVIAGKRILPTTQNQSLGVIQSNITDVYQIDKEGWVSVSPTKLNDISGMQDIKMLDITESVDMGGFFFDDGPLSEDGKQILAKKLTKVGDKYALVKPNSHFFTEDQTYYRYSWHPWLMLFGLLGKALVVFFTMMKVIQLIMELGVLKMFTTATAMTDIDGQRNKKLVMKIRNTFIVLYIAIALLFIYDLAIAFVNTSEVNVVVKAFSILVISIYFMDGPNFIEELLGIDAGLKSMSQSVIAATMGARGAVDATKGAGNIAKKGAAASFKMSKKGAGGLFKAGAAGKGALDGFLERQRAKKAAEGAGPPGGKGPGTSPGQTPQQGANSPAAQGASNGESSSGGTDQSNGLPPSTGGPSGDGSSGPGITPRPGDISSGSGSKPTGAATQKKTQNVKAKSPENAAKQGQKQAAQKVAAKQKQGVTKPGGQAAALLNGQKPLDTKPKLNEASLPKAATSAKDAMESSPAFTGRKPDKESVSDKLMGAYANTTQKMHDSKTMQQARKVYDVSKNTTRGKEK